MDCSATSIASESNCFKQDHVISQQSLLTN